MAPLNQMRRKPELYNCIFCATSFLIFKAQKGCEILLIQFIISSYYFIVILLWLHHFIINFVSCSVSEKEQSSSVFVHLCTRSKTKMTQINRLETALYLSVLQVLVENKHKNSNIEIYWQIYQSLYISIFSSAINWTENRISVKPVCFNYNMNILHINCPGCSERSLCQCGHVFQVQGVGFVLLNSS